MRRSLTFFLDHDVDAAVARALQVAGYRAWTAAQVGLNADTDDTLTVYAAEHDAVLVTHDAAFSRRRSANTVGRHIWLRCDESEAAHVLLAHLDELTPVLESKPDVFVRLTRSRADISFRWT